MGAVSLRVVQPFAGRAKVVRESAPHVSMDASRAQWTVPVPAVGKATLAYTVDFTV